MPLDSIALNNVMQPIAKATGLPNEAYIDPTAFEVEKQKVFFENWAGIGFGKDVPNTGDAVPIEFLGIPLLMLRDRSGAVRVFQNICRHRGMILVQEPTTIRGVIRCPYHSWCYGLDGSLRSTPDIGGPGVNEHPDVDKTGLGLQEVRATLWRDVVFVNLSGEAPAFEDYAAELIARWKEFDKPIHHGGPESSFNLTVNCNWKLAVENYCESYHLPMVHPGLNSYSRLEDHYHIEEDGKFSGQGTVVYNPQLDNTGRAFENFDDLSDKWDRAAEYVSFFPNVLFGVHRDHVYAILLVPKGLEETNERVEIYYANQRMLDGDYADLRDRNSRQWKGIFVEDVFVVEGMQKGRHAPRFDGGHFSPAMDGPTHIFHRWVASKLAG